jgi:protein O-GlcNAc transferase
MADGWRDINDLTDAQVAQRIREDEIDILVLLAGHFDSNRPQLAAWRAAPVQVSFHDPATSGLDDMDYIILDPILAPRHGPEKFSERVARLPSFYLHPPIIDAPAIGAVPATTRGHITFGSLNSPSKINVPVLRLWNRVLQAVPGSRLKLKFKNAFANTSLQQRILRDLDVDATRIDWETGEVSTAEHLALYNSIDIALDPFPFTGSTTTFESLWMGVPVVTLTTPAPAGRWSASILRTLGQEELIAGMEDDYVRIATGLAGDLQRLAAYRQSFRDGMAASPLCKGRARTRQVERLYRAMWRRWCKAAA